jgi:hypothetical protein
MDAVRYAHVNLVIHRGLCPGNVLGTPRGEAKPSPHWQWRPGVSC